MQGITNFIKRTGQALSKTKCVCTATSKELGDMLEARWADLQIKAVKLVKALGVGLGAGIRRNTSVLKKRLSRFRARLPRFRRLRQVKVNTARLVRTGLKAMTYGNAVTGTDNSLMHAQRQTAAAAAARGMALEGRTWT